MLAYSMAQLAAGKMTEHYKREMPEEEVLCITLYFVMALGEQKTMRKKKNRILLVCASGKASSRLLKYWFQREFGDYIDSLDICSVHELEQVIHELCEKAGRIVWLPHGFEESVLEREQYGATDFGNLSAIPYPRYMMTREMVVALKR